jgi:hypothetical protein
MLGVEMAIRVYRKTKPAGSNFSDATWALRTLPLMGAIQPLAGSTGIKSGQVLADAREYIHVETITDDVRNDDELEWDNARTGKVERRRVLDLADCSLGLLPHLEVYTGPSQWTRA